ncbi:MAG TPA: NADH-quinone oxidoreductase subunit H, partial [Halothiobacillus sp.]|nr:NADH-quinone oxidoreductase subunit H [Halothiobacillus sp.]
MTIVLTLLEAIFILLSIVIAAATLTWVERRLLGFWQDRLGPNRAGPFGIL